MESQAKVDRIAYLLETEYEFGSSTIFQLPAPNSFRRRGWSAVFVFAVVLLTMWVFDRPIWENGSVGFLAVMVLLIFTESEAMTISINPDGLEAIPHKDSSFFVFWNQFRTVARTAPFVFTVID